jgi:hypothetical protein
MVVRNRKLGESIKKQVAYKQEYKCSDCLRLLPPSYQIDHIIPHSISGDDTIDNLTALCPTCHANKTQKEHTRIIYYKKKSALVATKICYFCLEVDDESHKCEKTCKDIPKKQNIPINNFYKFANVPNVEINLSSSLNNLKIDDELLSIRINREYVHVNNFFTKIIDETLTPHDLGNIVKEATKTNDNYRKYTGVQIDIIVKNEGGPGADACIDYFYDILPSELPETIFKQGVDIKYIYFVDDE